MATKKSSIYWVLILSILALILGFKLSNQKSAEEPLNNTAFHGTYLSKPRPIQSFTFKGIDHKSFDNQSLKGKWTMLFFGFTHCASVCPATMAEMANMYSILEKNGVKQLPQVVLVSLDPKRDSLETLNAYVKNFNPSFYAARGSLKSVRKLAEAMGIAYEKVVSKDDAKKYDIQHGGTIMLINPKGKLTMFFTNPQEAEKLAQDYERIVSSKK